MKNIIIINMYRRSAKVVLFISAIVLMSAIAVISFSGCGKKKLADIDPAFAQYILAFTYGNISPDSYIQIELANEMPAVELNAEVKEKLFSFSPAIKGKTYWVNSNTVRFVPETKELKPGRAYKAKFHLNKVLKVDKKFKVFNFGFKVNEQNFSIDVLPYSPISSSDLKWNRVEAELMLANTASTDDVKAMFELSGATKQSKVQVTAANGAFKITIDSLLRTDKPQKYQLKVNGKPIGVKKTLNFDINIPALSKENFEVVDVRLMQKADPHVRITFSDPVNATQTIEDLINISGISNYTYQVDKNVVKIYPETFPQSDITVQIKQDIRSNAGLYLQKDYSFVLNVQPNKPMVKFEKNGNILPNSEQLNLPFTAVNLWAVDVKVIKIYQNNILYYLQSNTLANNTKEEIRRFGRLIMKKRIRLDVDKSMDLSKWNNFSIDLSTLFKKDPGALYMVKLSMKPEYSLYRCGGITPRIPESSSQRSFADESITQEDEEEWDKTNPYYFEDMYEEGYSWEDRDDPCKPSYFMNSDLTAETVVMASNVGMIAKGGNATSMSVAVTDILTTEPISGAKVNIYNYQMQVIGSGKTDGKGFADIDYKNGKPFVVTAANGKDVGYLEVKDEVSLSLSNFDVSGKEIQKGLKGYVYGERGVWRPGDTIHLSFILEDKMQKLPKGHPVLLEVYTPTRQFYKREVKTESVNGFYTFNIATDPSAQTGTWQAYVKVGGTSFYKPLHIETIKPNRLKVRLSTDSIINASRGVFSGTLKSEWLHGAPASNLRADVEISLSKTTNPFNGYKDYVFNNPLASFETNKYKLFDGTLNASGVAAVSANVPVAENAPGMLRGNILSRVFETGGDMSFYSQTVYYSPYAAYLGIKTPETQSGFLETDKPVVFDVVSVNPYGKKIARTNLEYKVYKLKWSWWWGSANESDLGSYVNNTAVTPVASGTFSTTGGNAKIRFQVDYPEWGRYLIIVKDPEGKHVTGTVFYVDWPSWRGRSNKTDPNGLTMLSFSTDKSSYQVGEKATVIIPKSSNGRVLISIENGSHIIQREWVKTSAKEDTKYTFKVTEEMNPNFYIFATLLQPHAQKDNDLPIRMYGVINVNVEDKNSKLSPVISMPNELRPEKEFAVSVSEKSGKPMTYTLAIVDEGLLDLTSFKTPNAWDEFYAREALGVRTWDLFDRVLGANTGMLGPLLSIGGDEALKASSDKVNRFKPVVKFMGPFTIKGGEKKTHKIKLPQYIGSVRVMLVAGANGAYGSAEKTVPVRNALMTLSTLPRIMGPNEEVWLPVNVFAMEKKVKSVQITVQTNGLLNIIDGATKTISFDNVGDKVVFFKMKASKRTGAEQVRILAKGGGETATEIIDIGVRNPNPPLVVSQSQIIAPGTSVMLSALMESITAADWAKIEISRMPGIDFNKNIQYLLEYPHGCSEQLTSQGFPLLYAGDFSTFKETETKRFSEKVSQIIKMLSARQLVDGGFMYWPGDSYANEWVTTYVGHFFTEAKNKGYEVPENVMSNWVKFQQKIARGWNRTSAFNTYYGISMTELQQAYRLYTLALSGNAELGAMNRMREIPNLTLQAKWRLAAAYALAGKKDVANKLVFNVSDRIDAYGFNNDTYGTPARDQAMIMETYLLLGKIDKAMGLAQNISEQLSSQYISTQEAAYGMIAMAQLASKMGKGNMNANWSVNGQKAINVSTAQPLYTNDIKPNEKLNVNIANNGKSKLYVRFTVRTQPLEENIPPVESSLKLSVKYTDMSGSPIDVTSLKQGKDFKVMVTVANTSSEDYTDLALVHIFPSGWEILNDRVINQGGNTSASFNYRDFRDDRVLTYFNLQAGQSKTFSVQLQAAYRGTYYLPPVSCQPMYNTREQSRTTGQWVSIVQ